MAWAPRSVLDAGCGSGRAARRARGAGVDVVGADVDESMVATARRLNPELTWIVTDLRDLDVGRSFDVVLMAGNVPLFTPEETRPALVAGCARHVDAGGALVAGFQLDRGYSVTRPGLRGRWPRPGGALGDLGSPALHADVGLCGVGAPSRGRPASALPARSIAPSPRSALQRAMIRVTPRSSTSTRRGPSSRSHSSSNAASIVTSNPSLPVTRVASHATSIRSTTPGCQSWKFSPVGDLSGECGHLRAVRGDHDRRERIGHGDRVEVLVAGPERTEERHRVGDHPSPCRRVVHRRVPPWRALVSTATPGRRRRRGRA